MKRTGCDIPRRNLLSALERARVNSRDEVRKLLGARDPSAGRELVAWMQRTSSVLSTVKRHCVNRSDKCCVSLIHAARDFYNEADSLRELVERQAGEERMHQGYFGDLGRHPWKPRKRRGPACRRVWVRGYMR